MPQVSSILNLSAGSPADLAQLASQLKSSEEALSKTSAASLANALGALDPGRHSLGWLYLLCVTEPLPRARHEPLTPAGAVQRGAPRLSPPGRLHEPGRAAASRRRRGAGQAGAGQVCVPLTARRGCVPARGADSPWRMRPPRLAACACTVAKLCRRLREVCVTSACPGRCLLALAVAAAKVAPSPQHLTPQLVDLLQLSLLANNVSAVLPLLDADILEVDPPATGLVAKDFLLYCFYGALAR